MNVVSVVALAATAAVALAYVFHRRTAAVAPQCPKCYVMIHNTCNKRNIGSILRTASALGVEEILFVGSKKSCQFFGAQGSQRRMKVTFFHHLPPAVAYLRSLGCLLCGVEITSAAKNLRTNPFYGPTCFILGNEGAGLSGQDRSVCDYFVYVPQCGDGIASLNVATAAGMVMYQFGSWAGYGEEARMGEKFTVRLLAPPEAPTAGEESE